MLKPVKCKVCGKTMQWQMSSDDCLLHCHDRRRAVVVFDNMTFNQDIYITYKESGSGASAETFNYYIE